MKGTILDFLKLTSEKPELAKDFVALAAKYEFEFSDEVSDQELQKVAGGSTYVQKASGTTNSEIDSTRQAIDEERELIKKVMSILAESFDPGSQEERTIWSG